MANKPRTLGQLKKAGYQVLPIREELRNNLIAKIQNDEDIFPGIEGYEQTVVPQLQNAILSGQDIILLGERGQAKSRIIRSLTSLFDEWTPVIDGVELPENPFEPISPQGRALVNELGNRTPIRWMHREERYGEKLATPDITIADLIGEVDPIKVAEGLYLSDELTIHYGLIPRTNRGIFGLNELPDLAERIQVGLLNVMEEHDVQIRGHKIRLPLDVIVVATANPEDYTNRGRIITPLKDRYGAQIRTHYPPSAVHEMDIMEAEANHISADNYELHTPAYMKEIIAEISRLARRSPDVSQRSGVSVRASIASYEALQANAIRRAIRLNESLAVPRISDLSYLVPSLQGKIEFETIEEGKEDQIIQRLIDGAVVSVFNRMTDSMNIDIDGLGSTFSEGLSIDVGEAKSSSDYESILSKVTGLRDITTGIDPDARPEMQASLIELVLEGMHLNKLLNKDTVGGESLYQS
ncbi:MAG: sigma 54-interacting transcriptional regulator [Dehalococcoidia bacterium]|nr:sigma 54-interacting transcriptional regulator [Dehalococcoidia bacterium]